MSAADRPAMSWRGRLRLWLSTPIAARAVLLAGLGLVAYGYGQVWQSPGGDVEQVTRQVVGGILAVIAGAGLVGLVAFWRD